MSTPHVVFEGVAKRYGSVTAVHRVDLEIQRGEFIALMGPSGCGKTTTLRMLAGLESVTSGEIRLNGDRINDLSPQARDMPLVWQNLALFPFLTVRRNVEFGLKMRGVDRVTRRSRAETWMERLEIGAFAERRVDQLSGGQRQRVALARALVTEPEILLLDEPLSALDAHLVVRMQGVLSRLQRDLGITFVYVTHSQSEAFAMADRVVIMDQGHIAQVGAPREVYRAPATRFVADFVGRNNILSGSVVDQVEGVITLERSDGTFTATVSGPLALTPGDPAAFVIAANRVQISATAPDHGRESLAAQVVSEEFVGAMVLLYLETADGQELKAQLNESDFETLDAQPGQSLHVSWDPADVHVIADPTTP